MPESPPIPIRELTGNPYLDVCSPDDIRVKGTRIGIEHLLSLYLSGAHRSRHHPRRCQVQSMSDEHEGMVHIQV